MEPDVHINSTHTQPLVLTTVDGLRPTIVLHTMYSPLQRSNCSVVDDTTIICSTPNLNTTSLIPLDYALMFDDVPSTTQARLPISVQSDPSNFTLGSSQEVTIGIETFIRIVVCPIASTLTLLLYCMCMVCPIASTLTLLLYCMLG